MLGLRRRGRLGLVVLLLVVACSQGDATPAPGPPVPLPTTGTPRGDGSGPAGAPATPARVVVSYSELLGTQLPLWIALEAGSFQQRGLDVDLQLIESATGIPALLAGETQIAQLGGSNVLGAAVGGADLVIVATLAPVYPYLFQAHPSIRGVDDLRGQKVGVSRYGSSSDSATRVSLRKLGLDPERDLTLIQVGSASARTAAMLSGAIQGAVAQPPDTLVLEAQGFNNLFDLAALGLPTSQMVVATQRAYATDNHDVLQRYVDALMEASALQRQERGRAVEVLKKYLRSDDDAALGLAYEYFTTRILPAVPYPLPEQFDDALEQLADKNERARGFDVSRLLDSSFVQDAANRGVGR